MPMYTKSLNARRFLVLLVFLILILAGFFFWKRPLASQKSSLSAGEKIAQHVSNQDSDGDGLKDWEETIFRTDPHNPDTDGDGTSDKDEIAQGRDPLKAGPNDKIVILEQKQSAAVVDANNVTRDFTEKFVKGPITQILAGGGKPTIDTKTVEYYTNDLLNQHVLTKAHIFTQTEILNTSDDSIQARYQYFKDFDLTFKPFRSRKETEIDIVTQTFRDQNYDELKKLDEHIALYNSMIEKLKATKTPPSLQGFHISVLNYFSQFKLAAELMRNAANDPILTLLAVRERMNLFKEFENFLKTSEEKIIKEARQ